MIPKRVHCCWFGGKQLPRLAKDCISSWRRFLPEYDLTIWNEQTFDVEQQKYTSQAYAQGKYAFVSDYARFDLLHRYGGIYMDVDVEVVRPLDRFLTEQAFSGFEHDLGVAPGLILGAVPRHPLIGELRALYVEREFSRANGSVDLTTVVDITTELLGKKGLRSENVKQTVEGLAVYPIAYFCPMDRHTGKTEITEEAYTVHHYAGSWLSPLSKTKQRVARLLGPDLTGRVVAVKKWMRKWVG